MSKHRLGMTIMACAIASLAPAQTAPAAGRDSSAPAQDADVAWAQLSTMSSPAAPAPIAGKGWTPAEVRAQKSARAKALVEASDRAKVFYTTYPGHPKAKEAKRLEVTNLLDAVSAGDVTEEPRAIRVAMAYRNSRDNAESDRFQVATRMMHVEVARKQLRSPEARLSEYERQADNLLAEFPKYPDVYRMYLGVVRNAPEATARKVAKKILLAPAPDEIKQQANAVLDRYDLVGKHVALEFVAEDGKDFNIDAVKGSTVAVYVWSWTYTGRKSLFTAAQKAADAGVVVVGVSADKDVKRAREVISAENPPGKQYVDARGLESPIALRLKIIDVPGVYVFGPDGKLVGYGAAGQLSELLKRAGK